MAMTPEKRDINISEEDLSNAVGDARGEEGGITLTRQQEELLNDWRSELNPTIKADKGTKFMEGLERPGPGGEQRGV